MDSERKTFVETVAEKLIDQLRAGTAPWQRPWEPGQAGTNLPFNPTTGKRYKGINALQLMSAGREDQRWMTYKQAAAVDAQIRKGEIGTPIQYWKFTEEQARTDEAGKPLLDALGKPLKVLVNLERPRVFFATVFNAEQIDGLPPLQRKEQTWDAVERAVTILTASGAVIQHGEYDRAFYRPSTDSIHLPNKGQFPTADNYYATALHELGHWTGHGKRLDRDLLHPFGSEGYAKEELRAEIASMILGDELGIGHDPKQHAAYVGSWMKALDDDPLEIFRAAADAEKIQEYVMSLEQNRKQEQAVSAALNVGIAEVLRYADTSNIDDIELAQVELEINQVTKLGLNTLQDVTGTEQARFLETALKRLAPVFDLDASNPINAFFADREHQALAERFVYEATERLNSIQNRQDQPAQAAPDSTDENTSTDKKMRKHAEVAATMNDEDLQRRIALEELKKVQQASNADAVDRMFINVPFKQKEEAKALGAKWDRKEQSWYVPSGQDSAPFVKWIREGANATASDTRAIAGDNQTNNPAEGRQYLAVPYSARVEARAAGAMWDKTAKSWYAGINADMSRLGKWKPENVSVPQDPAMTPREEFAEALVSVGCVISGEHPIMDGAKHRISVEGEKFTQNSGSGFYVGHLDGHPAGYVKNNKTGAELTWKAKGYTLPPEQKALLLAEAAAKLQQREAELSKLQDQAAKRVVKQLAKLLPIDQPTPYMLAKGIEPQEGAFTDQEGKKTYLPATDAEGKQWTMQYIHDDGTKRFAKDSRKEGCFHVVGGMPELAKTPALVICEGYATAASLKQSLGYATVSAFDSGNLAMVAQALHQKFPDKPVVIAGDDDRHLEIVQGVNPGRTKAEEAAKLVGGRVLLPIFAPGENSFPADIEQVTPALYRERQEPGSALSSEQVAVLARMKQFTDFNDLATKSELGRDGVDRQVRSFVDHAIEKHSLAQVERQQQERIQTQTSAAVQAETPRRRHAIKLR